jgi:hypothetical protein
MKEKFEKEIQEETQRLSLRAAAGLFDYINDYESDIDFERKKAKEDLEPVS